MGEPFEDWSAWRPATGRSPLPCRTTQALTPYTSAYAMAAGWRWRIPLQHRTGNGYVFASAFIDDQAATDALLGAIEGAPLAEAARPALQGRAPPPRARVGNCIAIGLSGGFLEPLESTSIYLIQAAITALLELFPDGSGSPIERDAFNRTLDLEYARIRDFLILHYHATDRTDSAFWDYVRTMPIPDSLSERIALFRARGRIEPHAQGLFLEPSWLAVLIGRGILPRDHDVRADMMADADLAATLQEMRDRIAATSDGMAPARRLCRRLLPGRPDTTGRLHRVVVAGGGVAAAMAAVALARRLPRLEVSWIDTGRTQDGVEIWPARRGHRLVPIIAPSAWTSATSCAARRAASASGR